MKLLNYTSSYFAAVLLVLIAVWAVVFYFEMLDEIYDSLDDGLANQKILVIQKAKKDPAILKKEAFGEGDYKIKKIGAEKAKHFTDSYRDTLMFMQNEKDFEPVRLLETVFEQGGSYYKMKLITSMVEEDDLIEDLLYSLVLLYLGLMASILLLNNLILRKVWQPFYKLLSQLKNFRIEKDETISFEKTKIEEFLLLNEHIEGLLQKSRASYKSQKEFIENAAHELQTPLSIGINQLELLLENNTFDEKQLLALAAVLNNLERLARFNKSLLLLSKIENKQYVEEENVDINSLIKQILMDFEDLAFHRSVSFKLSENGKLIFKMNKILARVLFTNLLKNALVHGEKNRKIEILIEKNGVSIKNQAGKKPLKTEKLFDRFYKKATSQSSSGLGLAISKAIAEKYNLYLEYRFSQGHIFKVGFDLGVK